MPGEALALLTAFLYGLSTFLVRVAMQRGIGSEAATLVTLCYNSVLFMVLLGFRAGLGTLSTPRWMVIGLFALAGLLGPVLGRSTLYASVRRIGPSRASSLKTTSPVMAALLAVAFLGERVGALGALGIGLVVLGVYLISRKEAEGKGDPAEQAGRNEAAATADPPAARLGVGSFLALASAAFYAAANVLRRYSLTLLPDALLGSAIGSLAATAVMVALAAARGNLRHSFTMGSPGGRRVLVVSSLLSTTAILTNYMAMARLPASIAVPLVNVEPLFVMFISSVLFRGREERLTWPVVAGALVILAGVWALLAA